GDTDEKAEPMPVDLAANAASLGAHVMRCKTYDDFVAALKMAQTTDRTTMVYIQNDRYAEVPGYDSWWDVAVAEVSAMDTVREARRNWEEMRAKERYFL
ncbi:MAG TPA: thiamine pyrophosphate-dependent enzyme, partial [Candidatus Hydrogenedentes bacterium]|nr:thiamine pyrophosphate-dependent enzyme [Candidatus Hydrogenedentota bacterium]